MPICCTIAHLFVLKLPPGNDCVKGWSCADGLPVLSLSAEEALERIQRAFDTRLDEGRRSPETAEQLEFVRTFVASLGHAS